MGEKVNIKTNKIKQKHFFFLFLNYKLGKFFAKFEGKK